MLIDYLLTAGLVSRAEVVKGAIKVRVLHHKNVCYHVTSPSASYLLKTARLHGDTSGRVEAEMYAILRRSDTTFVDRYLPTVVSFDSGASVLVIQYQQQAVNLHRYHDEADTALSLATMGGEIGLALTRLHAPDMLSGAGLDTKDSCPWVLRLLEPPVAVLFSESTGTIEVIRLVQHSAELAALIGELRDAWTCDALIHHDMRLENILFDKSATSPGASVITIVDWELCAPGWSYWDVACIFASYVSYWALAALASSFLKSPSAGFNSGTPHRNRPITDFHPLLHALWQSYSGSASGFGTASDCIIVSRLISARLIQIAMEHCQGSVQPTREAIQLLEIAKTFARRPAEGWVHVLGLRLGTTSGRVLVDVS